MQSKVVLLNFDQANRLVEALCHILAFSRTELLVQSFEVGERADSRTDLVEVVSRFHPHLIFMAMLSSSLEGTGAFLRSLNEKLVKVPIIVVAEVGGPDEIFELLQSGAADYIIPPLKVSDVLPRLWRLLRETSEEETFIHTLKEKLGLQQLIGQSEVFLSQIKKLPLIAKCDATVLIAAETGTGKELLARAIHYLSPRSIKPFIPVNCGAIPSELAENELFGHERGAFTSAFSAQPGVVREAEGGTIFLDEIDCFPPHLQVKLLRLLQEKEYRMLGSAKIRKADLRIIAATNTDVEQALTTGRLRRDLYYRLNVIPLTVPPLRERREDIPLLARHFLARYSAELNQQVIGFSLEAMQRLVFYDWPGNVRELEHVVERAVIFAGQKMIQADDICLPNLKDTKHPDSFHEAKGKVISQFEKSYIQRLLLAYQGNITRAAEAAQKNRRAFWQLMRKHRISAHKFKSTDL